MITEIKTTDEYNTLIKNNIALVDFYADWCGPCKMLTPILKSFSEAHPEVSVGKVDVDKEALQPIAADLRIRGIPALFWFKNGIQVKSHSGMTSLTTLNETLVSLA